MLTLLPFPVTPWTGSSPQLLSLPFFSPPVPVFGSYKESCVGLTRAIIIATAGYAPCRHTIASGEESCALGEAGFRIVGLDLTSGQVPHLYMPRRAEGTGLKDPHRNGLSMIRLTTSFLQRAGERPTCCVVASTHEP